jgi:hypothetical protein
MTEDQMDDFETLLNEQDPDLFKWVSGKGHILFFFPLCVIICPSLFRTNS